MSDNARIATSLAQNDHVSMRITSAGTYEAPVGRDFPLHHHTEWELVYYRSGNIRGTVGSDWYEMEPGTMLATPPLTAHSEIARTAYSNYHVTIDAPSVHPWPIQNMDDADGEMERIFASIVRECRMDSGHRKEMLALLLRQLDIAIERARQSRHQPETEKLVSQAARIMDERFASKLQITDVAREIGASPSALRRQFVLGRGKSPMAYLQDVRVRHAIDLLRSSNLILETIASMCGYDSASHLSRHIKRAAGKSPGQLRYHQKHAP